MKKKHIIEPVPQPEGTETKLPETEEHDVSGSKETEQARHPELTRIEGTQSVTGKRAGSTVKMEIQADTDYYVLFRDVSAPQSRIIGTPIGARQQHSALLCCDTASYVWGYVGTLNGCQAKIVREIIDSEFDDKFNIEALENGWVCEGIRNAANPAVRAYVPTYVRGVYHSKVPKKDRSYIELLPLPTLKDIWQRFVYAPSMCVLEHTAGIWVMETSWETQYELSTNEEIFNPAETELLFQSSIAGQKLTPFQQGVLARCGDIAKNAQDAGGKKDESTKMVVDASMSQPSITETSKLKPPGSGRKKTLHKRLSAFFDDLERKVYDEHDPLTPAGAYRYTKEKIADELKSKYPKEFKGKVGSIAKQIQIQPSWKKWYYETREKFIGENCDGLNQNDLRLEKFESVVHDYLAYIQGLKDRMRDKKHGIMYEKEYNGVDDEEYLTLTKRITPMMVAQWAKQNEADYNHIGEIFRWNTSSLAVEFAKTNEWQNREVILGIFHRVPPRRKRG